MADKSLSYYRFPELAEAAMKVMSETLGKLSEEGLLCSPCRKRFPASAMRTCDGCNVECYCSVDCQRVDWKATHKVDCLALCTALRGPFRPKNPTSVYLMSMEATSLGACVTGCLIAKRDVESIDGVDDGVDHSKAFESTMVSALPSEKLAKVNLFGAEVFGMHVNLASLTIRQMRLLLNRFMRAGIK